mmetsp:Transcript_16848/g.26245  ORF Transcript_16848/g.26245 Transcript_16848/m.26245 type:complete len:99 (+) Transcript_16848:2-298(+)
MIIITVSSSLAPAPSSWIVSPWLSSLVEGDLNFSFSSFQTQREHFYSLVRPLQTPLAHPLIHPCSSLVHLPSSLYLSTDQLFILFKSHFIKYWLGISR